jgi:hypothetical protein
MTSGCLNKDLMVEFAKRAKEDCHEAIFSDLASALELEDAYHG